MAQGTIKHFKHTAITVGFVLGLTKVKKYPIPMEQLIIRQLSFYYDLQRFNDLHKIKKYTTPMEQLYNHTITISIIMIIIIIKI